MLMPLGCRAGSVVPNKRPTTQSCKGVFGRTQFSLVKEEEIMELHGDCSLEGCCLLHPVGRERDSCAAGCGKTKDVTLTEWRKRSRERKRKTADAAEKSLRT